VIYWHYDANLTSMATKLKSRHYMMKSVTSDQSGCKEELKIYNMNSIRKDFVQDSRSLAWGLQRLWLQCCDSTTSTLKTEVAYT